MGTVRAVHSDTNGIDILTFYEDELPLGSMRVAGFAGPKNTNLSLNDVRDVLPKKEELWWDNLGFEIRGGGVRIFFHDRYQVAGSTRPDVLRIMNLIWGSPVLLGNQLRGDEEDRRRRTERIEEWFEDHYPAARAVPGSRNRTALV